MKAFPVMRRELLLAARRPGTYRARVVCVVVVSLVGFGVLYGGFAGAFSAGKGGRGMFWLLGVVGYALALCQGAFCTADCLSSEKREGTLGLLLLTGLNPFEIVAGKLTANAARPAYNLLGALPTMGFAIFLGGVTGADFFRMILALLNTLFVAVSLGLLVSSVCRSERRALIAALCGAVVLGVAVPALGLAWRNWRGAAMLEPIFIVGSPATAFLFALEPTMPTLLATSFGSAFWKAHLLGWLFLLAASLLLRLMWQDLPDGGRLMDLLRRKGARGGAASASSPVHSFRQRQGWLEVNPVIWLGGRGHGLGLNRGILALLVVWEVGALLLKGQWFDLPVYGGTVLALHLFMMFAVTLQACSGPAEDRHTGVLELLLTTPLGLDAVLEGRLLSLKRQCVVPLALVLLVDVAMIYAGCEKLNVGLSIAWTAGILFLFALLVLNLYCLSWVGVWQGFRLGRASVAVRQTLYYVLFLRWIVLVAVFPIPAILTGGTFFQSDVAAVFGVGAYLALFGATILTFCGLAVDELRSGLRVLATLPEEGGGRFDWSPFPRSLAGGSLTKLVDSVGVMDKRLRKRVATPPVG